VKNAEKKRAGVGHLSDFPASPRPALANPTVAAHLRITGSPPGNPAGESADDLAIALGPDNRVILNSLYQK
jgi:hypothetical protein